MLNIQNSSIPKPIEKALITERIISLIYIPRTIISSHSLNKNKISVNEILSFNVKKIYFANLSSHFIKPIFSKSQHFFSMKKVASCLCGYGLKSPCGGSFQAITSAFTISVPTGIIFFDSSKV